MLVSSRKDFIYLLFIWFILALLILLFVVPFWWMLITSLKTGEEVYTKPYSLWLKNPRWSNYKQVFSALPFLGYLLNTIKVTAFVCLGTLITSSMAAFAFSRLQFPGRDSIFFLYLATLMVPKQVILIPDFILFKWMGLLDNHLALIFTGIFTAYGTFLLRQFFLGIPKELEEAATLDGYGPFRRFYHIIIPLAKPALTTLFIMTVLNLWNEYLYALVFIQSD
ncbi:MAG: carbohydrate ABC transporter permease, partial [Lachnospiraceae bacterium]|nr:carbohydrate ABC transporter permease [Lachnospiraceae bacterium]